MGNDRLIKRRILYITGTRADYGLMVPVLKAIQSHEKLALSLIVTGMHLSEEFGETVREIEGDNLKIDAKVPMLSQEDTGAAMASGVGKCLLGISMAMERIRPTFLLLLGDRGEMLAGAISATYMNIPIAHIHGGEVSGSADNPVRHAITKLAHIHFPATKSSAHRIEEMGEASFRIFLVGSPSLDSIANERGTSIDLLAKKYSLDFDKPLILVIQHPVTTEADSAANQIRVTLKAIVELQHQTIIVYPNADAGGRRMIRMIEQYRRYPFMRILESIPRQDFLALMRSASVMVGNSSSGLIEAPSFKLPVVNIGTRQKGRERAGNVIDVGYDRSQIKATIERCLCDQDFLEITKKCSNPYGDGKAGHRIADVLANIEMTPGLLRKEGS